MSIEKEKLEAIKQWTNDPCGAVYAPDNPIGTERYFDAVADYRYITHPWIKDIIDSIDVKGKTLLDVGCGMGTDLVQFAKRDGIVYGVDLTPRSIEITRQLFDIKKLTVGLCVGDAENIPYKDNAFDVVYSMGVLHHTPDIEKAISEIHRVLKPNGQVIVGLYHKNSWQYWANLIFIGGILSRKLFRMSAKELLSSSHIEISHSGANPLVRVYSKSDCQWLFKKFSEVKIRKYHWVKEQIYLSIIQRLLPDKLPSCFGWYIVVSAKKVI